MAAQADRPCSALAYGDVKRVELAMALAHDPLLLLMDEPTAGMAPGERVALMQLTRQLAQQRRMGVLFTEHSMDVVSVRPTVWPCWCAASCWPKVRRKPFATMRACSRPTSVPASFLKTAMNQMHSNQRLMDKGKSPKLLEVQNLDAWYGAAHILHQVSLAVGRGEVVALMGRNGAGKSTTLKSIAALVPRREGSIRFMGEAIEKKASHQIAQRGLGYVPEDRRIFTELTVLENLEVGKQKPRRWPDGRPCRTGRPKSCLRCSPTWARCPSAWAGA
jgi:branched-chain amino acid transport system ATP-binding protein